MCCHHARILPTDVSDRGIIGMAPNAGFILRIDGLAMIRVTEIAIHLRPNIASKGQSRGSMRHPAYGMTSKTGAIIDIGVGLRVLLRSMFKGIRLSPEVWLIMTGHTI